MMGHKEKLKGGDEYDAFTNWRKVVAMNHGERSKIKRRFNKRQRREFKRINLSNVD